MGIVLDIVVVVLFLVSAFLGYKKGLINVIFNLCAFIIAFILTWILYTPVSNLIINNTQLDENIKSTIIEKGVVEENEENNQEKSNKKEKSKDESNVNKYVENYVSKAANEAKNEIVKSTADIVAEKTVAIIVAIGLFIVIRLILILLRFVANGIAELPLIKQCNEVGGLAYGIIRGLFVIYLLFAICFIVMSVNNIEAVSNVIDGSFISKFIYNNNIILKIIF